MNNKKHEQPPFGRLYRLGRNLTHLRSAVNSEDVEEIADRLPVFVRSYFYDVENSALDVVNRCDMILTVAVANRSSSRDGFKEIGFDVLVQTKIHPDLKNSKISSDMINHIGIKDFLNMTIIKIKELDFSVLDFLFSILYTSGVHAAPSKNNSHLQRLYTEFVEVHTLYAKDLLKSISKCVLRSVDGVFDSNSESFAQIHDLKPIGRAAKLVQAGRVLINKQNNHRIHYDYIAMQGAVHGFPKSGVALRTDTRLLDSTSAKDAYIFSFGNRRSPNSQIHCYHRGSKIFVQVGCSRSDHCKFDANRMMSRNSRLDVEVFTSRDVCVFANGHKAGAFKIPFDYEFCDGKIVLGADLDGKKRGSFWNSYCILDHIDAFNVARSVRTFAMTQRKNFQPSVTHPLDLRRTSFI